MSRASPDAAGAGHVPVHPVGQHVGLEPAERRSRVGAGESADGHHGGAGGQLQIGGPVTDRRGGPGPVVGVVAQPAQHRRGHHGGCGAGRPSALSDPADGPGGDRRPVVRQRGSGHRPGERADEGRRDRHAGDRAAHGPRPQHRCVGESEDDAGPRRRAARSRPGGSRRGCRAGAGARPATSPTRWSGRRSRPAAAAHATVPRRQSSVAPMATRAARAGASSTA